MGIKHFWVVVLVMSVLVGCGGSSEPNSDDGTTVDTTTVDTTTDGTTTVGTTTGGTTTDSTVSDPVVQISYQYGNYETNDSLAVQNGGSLSWDLTPSPGYTLQSAEGCGGSLTDNNFTVSAVSGDCTVTAVYAAEKFVLESRQDTADFTVVKPGLAYTCGIQHSGAIPHTTADTSRVIVQSAFLPPAVPTVEMGGGFAVHESAWMLANAVDADLYPGTASCSITHMQDAAQNTHLVVAYDELGWVEPWTYPVRTAKYVVIPLLGNGLPAAPSAWTYQTLQPGIGVLAADYTFPGLQVKSDGTALNLLYYSRQSFNPTASHYFQYKYYSAFDEVLYNGGNAMKEITAPLLAEGLPSGPLLGGILPGSVDTKLNGGVFEVTALTGVTGITDGGVGGWMQGVFRYRFAYGEMQEEFSFGGIPTCIAGQLHSSFVVGQRADADYVVTAQGIGFVGEGYDLAGDADHIFAATGAGNYAQDENSLHCQQRTGVGTKGSLIIDENGNLVASDPYNTNPTNYGGVNQSAFIWDSFSRNNTLYVLFRNPQQEPDRPLLTLIDVDFAYDGTSNYWATPEMQALLDATPDPAMWAPRPGIHDYEVPDIAGFRERTTCLARNPYGTGTDPYLRFPLDVACNNLLKTTLYRQSDTAQEQLLFMYADKDFRLKLQLENLPE